MSWMRGAFVLARPPERIASARAASGAATTRSHVGNASRSDVNARSAFTSLVCWLKTVRISSSRGSATRGGVSGPKRRSRRRRIARTRRGVAFGSVIAPDGTERDLLGLTARCVAELRQRRLEAEPDGAGRPIAVLRQDQLGLALLLVIGVVAMDEHDDVAILLERSRLPQIGELRALVRARPGFRFSWDSARIGTLSSFARSFNEREISATSCCRLSWRRVAGLVMSWR